MRGRIEAFDEPFDDLLERDGVRESGSRRHALAVMRERYAAARRKVRDRDRENGRLLDAWMAGEASLVRSAKRRRP